MLLHTACAALALYTTWHVLWAYLLRRSFREETIVELVPLLRQSRDKKLAATCVVAGGSLAGCAAAKMASKHFDRVLLVEPYVDGANWNTRVGQANHGHSFWPQLRLMLTSLYGCHFSSAVYKSSGRDLDMNRIAWRMGGKEIKLRDDSLLPGYAFSRVGLQSIVRSFTLDATQTPGVQSIVGKVVRIRPTPDGRGVAAVGIQRSGDSAVIEWVDCALVLDCTGPAGGHARWIRDAVSLAEKEGAPLNWAPPVKDRYDSSIVYIGTIVDIPDDIRQRLPLPPQ